MSTVLTGRRHLNLGFCQVDLGSFLTLCGLIGALLIAICVSISSGTTALTFWDVIRGILGQELSDNQMYAIFDNRLPRILMAVMAGFMVAVVGGLLQALAQNPLADPGILGISQGSIMAIMLVLFFFPHAPEYVFTISGMAGALIVGAGLLLLVGNHQQGGIAIILMGIAVETTLSSITTLLILHTPYDVSRQLKLWAMGSLNYSNWDKVHTMVLWIGFCISAIILLGKRLRLYDLGDQGAVSLGENIRFSKPILIFMAVSMTAYSVAAVGPLTFLGVIAPNLGDFISSARGGMRLIIGGIIGAFILVCADFMTRIIVLNTYMPVGMTLIIVGVPLFIITMRLRNLRSRLISMT